MDTRTMSNLSTTPEPDWLHTPHAGELLAAEFMAPHDLDVAALAQVLAIDAGRLQSVIEGSMRIDADLDLRLARYFRMSEGFFLGLQDDHELLEAKRVLNGALDRIVPRAA